MLTKKRRVLFAPELLVALTRGRFEVVENAIPASAKVKGYGADAEAGALYITIEDESFEAVEIDMQSQQIPTHSAPVVKLL